MRRFQPLVAEFVILLGKNKETPDAKRRGSPNNFATMYGDFIFLCANNFATMYGDFILLCANNNAIISTQQTEVGTNNILPKAQRKMRNFIILFSETSATSATNFLI